MRERGLIPPRYLTIAAMVLAAALLCLVPFAAVHAGGSGSSSSGSSSGSSNSSSGSTGDLTQQGATCNGGANSAMNSCSNSSGVGTPTAAPTDISTASCTSSGKGAPTICTCHLSNGTVLSAGQSVTTYAAPAVPFGQSCSAQTRTCDSAGNLSGSYQNYSCSIATPASCNVNGVSVAHGATQTFYSTTAAPVGQTCAADSQSRTCYNGTMSGSGTYQYATCTDQPKPSIQAFSVSPGTVSTGATATATLSVTNAPSCTLTGTNSATGAVTETKVLTNPSQPSTVKAFATSASWTVPSGVTVLSALVVGGGGGGGSSTDRTGGGGGGGGVAYQASYGVTPGQVIAVTVGAGGGPNAAGGNSAFGTIVAYGGGRGGENPTHATAGGSGGGAYHNATDAGAAGTAGQGYAGGNGYDSGNGTSGTFAGGGGGGGGSIGSAGTAAAGGNGGTGRSSSISGIATLYGGGGGGGAQTLASAATFCANENGYCSFSGTKVVRYGANNAYYYGTFTNGTACSNGVFGDPAYGYVKACYIMGSVSMSAGAGGAGGGGAGGTGTGSIYANGISGTPNTGGGGGGAGGASGGIGGSGGSGAVIVSYGGSTASWTQSYVTAPISATTNYSLMCTGLDGSSIASAGPQVVTLQCTPTTYCSAGVLHAKGTNCSDTVIPSPYGKNYGCSNGAYVVPPPPSISSFIVTPAIVHAGGVVKVSWVVSADTAGCSLAGDANSDSYSGAAPYTTKPITTDTTYTLTCVGYGGSASPAVSTEMVHVVPLYHEL